MMKSDITTLHLRVVATIIKRAYVNSFLLQVQLEVYLHNIMITISTLSYHYLMFCNLFEEHILGEKSIDK